MGDNSGMPAVLIVEDSENSAATLEIAFLGIPGLSVLMAPSAAEALRILDGRSQALGALVTDLIASTQQRLVAGHIRSLGDVRACHLVGPPSQRARLVQSQNPVQTLG